MRNFKLRWGSIALMMLFSTGAFLLCDPALAQVNTKPVNGFVIINPISLCSGGLCAPFGLSCTSATGTQLCTQFATPSTATVTTPIGVVDADTSVNLTRAFWAQAGIDVAFLPVQSYNSPTNTIPSSWNNIKDASTGSTFTYLSGTYQTLHLVNVPCQDGFIALTSPDFQALTQHSICTEHGGLAGSYSKLVNPPPAPAGVPLASTLGSTESNALDVFFVNTYSGTGVTIPQYGFSWINGDGVSVGKLAFTTSRFDTLGHETGHAMGLDHGTYGAGMADNLMSSGSARATSQKSGCLAFSIVGSTATSYNAGALFDLDYSNSSFNPCDSAYAMNTMNGLADQLTPGSACPSPLSMATCTTQEGAAAISPFINQTLPSTANAGGGSPTPLAGAATTSNTAVSAQSTSSSSGVPFQVTAISEPDNPNAAMNSIIIALPDISGLTFSGSSPATFVSCTDNNTNPPSLCGVRIINQVRLNGNSGIGNSNCVKSINLAPPSVECLQIFFSTGDSKGAAFVAGDTVAFNVALNKDLGTIQAGNLLAGTQYTPITAAGYSTTSLFGSAVNGVFSADSRHPDFTTPNQIDPNFVSQAVVNLGPILSKCTPPYITVKIHGKLVTVCPDGNLPAGPD